MNGRSTRPRSCIASRPKPRGAEDRHHAGRSGRGAGDAGQGRNDGGRDPRDRGAHPLEGKLDNLDLIEAAGYRLVALQHFFDNELGGSLHGIGDQGLTEFGRTVVAQVEKRGMILDVAHSSPQVARDVLAMTKMPIVVSHTGIHSFCANKRNFPDDLMQAIAATGGVIGIGYWDEVTCGDFTPGNIAKMVKAAIAVVGEDHVSLGSDFDGSVETAFDTSELPALTSALLDQGLSEAQVRKVMGENMLRVLQARLK
ncbi:dipeptidase [Seohaeicola zhoushanensis]